MKKPKLQIIIVVIYVLILAHFLVSNYWRVLGPNYVLTSDASNSSTPTDNLEILSQGGLCGSTNGSLTYIPNCRVSEQVPAKGFPFATTDNNDGIQLNALDASRAWLLNVMYIGLITGAFRAYYVWLAKKSKPGTKRR